MTAGANHAQLLDESGVAKVIEDDVMGRAIQEAPVQAEPHPLPTAVEGRARGRGELEQDLGDLEGRGLRHGLTDAM
jgi:hypothetical protein